VNSGHDRVFTHADWARLEEPCGPGLFQAAARRPHPGALLTGTTVAGEPVWRSPAPTTAAEAVRARAQGATCAVALAAGTGDHHQEVGLALAFAEHLAEHRTGLLAVHRTCVIAPTRPQVPADLVRIPHLLSVNRAGIGRDAALWEILPRAEIEPWLGKPLPEGAALIEDRLDQLLDLRGAAHDRTLPRTSGHGTLTDLLERGRYFSIRFVYQHIGLITDLLTVKDEVQ